jgi:hypothetical protein
MRLVVNKFFTEYLFFTCLYHSPIVIFIITLLFPEGQTGDCGNWDHWMEEYFHELQAATLAASDRFVRGVILYQGCGVGTQKLGLRLLDF